LKKPVLLEQSADVPLDRFHTKSALRTAALWSVKCTFTR